MSSHATDGVAWRSGPTASDRLTTITLMLGMLEHDQTGTLTAAIAALLDIVAHDGLAPRERELLAAISEDLEALREEQIGFLTDVMTGVRGWQGVGWRTVRLDRTVAEAVEGITGLRGHPLAVDLDPVEATVHDALVRRVVGNLVANAVRHTPTGTPVDVTLRADDEVATIRVSDHGPGVSPELREVMFEPFSRHAPASDRGGLGLGLMLVRAVAEHHGGTVAVEDRPGGGTTFVLVVPLVPPQIDRAGP